MAASTAAGMAHAATPVLAHDAPVHWNAQGARALAQWASPAVASMALMVL
eukprot:CAMPEP_0168477174 /NCGR_PEP_ID=MMETSP0228-20121227/62268_1 /TAXON_ID=133427 /ORGANISM="Protoceratium reticulatum, Strain CCCM 535 (=CCMP 1889)" /LENGTH=49 /DNA_ID= /DNA_START= /DNA_END= /DNA_ORIENTATION=